MTKGRCNYGVDLWYNQKSSHPKFFIHFFIDNSNANISLYALSCPNFNLGQLKVCKLMFTLKLSMKKWIKNFGWLDFGHTRDNCFRHLEKDMSTGLTWNWKTRHYELQEFKKNEGTQNYLHTPPSNEERVTKSDSKYKRYCEICKSK